MRPLYQPRTPSRRPATQNGNTLTRELTHKTQDPVQVFCRLRPVEHRSDSPCVVTIDDKLVKTNAGSESRVFTFEHVFPELASQSEVFDRVGLPFVEDLVAGKNGLLFAYGVTSSGKTYTIEGYPSDCGLLPRTIDVLFNSIRDNQTEKFQICPDGYNNFEVFEAPDRMLLSTRERCDTIKSTPTNVPSMVKWQNRSRDTSRVEIDPLNSYSVFISLVELYGQTINDLLDESSDEKFKEDREKRETRSRKKKVVTNPLGLCYVAHMVEKEVKDADEAIEVFNRGLLRRVTAKTALNSGSSRSHCVFNIRVVQGRKKYDGEIDDKTIQVSQLCLVDLAGSERSKRTGTTGGALQEAGNINKSLTVLRQCIMALREKKSGNQNVNPPYRDHSLTHLFKSYFEGHGSVKMILCVNPHKDELVESLYAMQFAVQAQDVVIEKSHYANPVRDLKERMLQDARYNLNDDIPDDEKFLNEWNQDLRMRRDRRANMVVAFKHAQSEFRKHLVAAVDEVDKLKESIKDSQTELKLRDEQIKLLESETRAKDRSRACMIEKLKALQEECKSLEAKLLEERRNKEIVQREKDQAESYAANFVLKEREHLKKKLAGLMRKDCCISKKELDSLWKSLGVTRRDMSLPLRVEDWPRVAPSAPRLSPMHTTPLDVGPSSSSGASTDVTTPPATTPSDRMTTRSRSSDKRVFTSGGKIPMCNPRSTRSLSTGSLGKWLYHCPKGTLDLGTVMVPKIKNRKSVNALDSKDFLRKDVAGYALVHHEADENGDIETSIFKGKIVKSEGGGANVILDDVEVMRQVSPPSKRKRAASDALPALANLCSPVSSNSTSERETSVKKYRL